jgi:hypothetical protein
MPYNYYKHCRIKEGVGASIRRKALYSETFEKYSLLQCRHAGLDTASSIHGYLWIPAHTPVRIVAGVTK